MKKRFVYAAMLCILLSLMTDGTLAYFTAQDTARNVITSGKVAIAVEEYQANGEEYPKDSILVMPASTVSKIVTVRNLDATSYIRARLDVTVKKPDGSRLEVDEASLKRVIKLTMNEKDWTEQGGWWYFRDAVSTGEPTTALMTQVAFDGPNMTNEYQNCRVEIDVIAQAVQAANNGKTVWEAAGWTANQS